MVNPHRKIRPSWLEWIKKNVRADFETGHLYWIIPAPGRRVGTPIGCKDTYGYIKLSLDYEKCYAHQVIWFLFYGEWPSEIIDHDNKKPWDNRIVNLVLSDHSKNALNSCMWITNTSGIKGASITTTGKYKVTKQGKHLGYFDTAKEARDAYNRYLHTDA